VRYGYNAASYSLIADVVSLPDPEQFDGDEEYYCTLFHELIHSTGNKKRLGRIEPALFGSDPYAREELVAEIGASFLAGVAGFEEAGGDQSAAYIAHWLTAIRNNSKLVIQAAAQAQKAADLILGTTFEEEDSRILESAEVAA
jgi:antirestriction protein ArdC